VGPFNNKIKRITTPVLSQTCFEPARHAAYSVWIVAGRLW